MQLLTTLLEVAGMACLSVAAALVAPALGLAVLGVCLVVAGIFVALGHRS